MKKNTYRKDALMTGLMFVLLIMALGFLVVGIPIPEVDAALSKEVRSTLSGVNLSTATGNATGAQTGVDLRERNAFAEEFTCYSFMTNSGGSAVVNTSTWSLEGSYDNSSYSVLQTTTIATSEIDMIWNATAGQFPFVRVNVGAIQNANSTYVNVQCVFK